MSNQKVSSSIPYLFSCWKYDVFLNFRGEDTRKNFTDHLHNALKKKGIKVFKDDKELERGKAILPGFVKAIEESRFSLIILSRNYAYSTWCLDELAKIVQCKSTNEQMVFPIFYDVEPTVVRKQTRNFQDAFAEHEETFRENIEKVQKWRNALTEVANLSGWDLKDRHEVEFIQEIVKEISKKLGPRTSGTLDDLVGINSRMKKLRLCLDIGCGDVRMIGICGMGGVGKTTLARVVYDLISHEFEGNCFLANVREISEKDGMIALQKQLLSDTLLETNIEIRNDFDGIQMIKRELQCKNVLVVIDDVVDVSQLNKLAGKHSWFGSGSRIIITTRDEHLLRAHRVDEVYKTEAFDEDEALELFTKKAFRGHPSKDYVELTKRVVKYAGGLPLALEVLGSFLFGRTVDEWRSTLQRLNKDSEDEILNVLEISFNGLKDTEKKIFLDVACFFKGEDKDYVTRILDGCGFDPIIGIAVLIDKSLITILDNNKLWMHDLLQEMGQQIVKRKSPEEPGKRSRLWKVADVSHVLTKNTGTEVVEGIILDFPKEKVHLSASGKAFLKMTNLRLLKIHNVQLPEGLEYISDELRLLQWHGYPLKSLPSNLQLDRTLELNMCYSHLEQLWKGIKPLNKLKIMTLSLSQYLIRTPDFTGVPNLEELILEGCTRLREIQPSLLVHDKLVLLNLEGCTSLTTLPSKIAMKSLRKLILSRCSKLNFFPEIVGSMECLSELFLDGTAIEELPLSIELLTGLVLLNLNDCNNLLRLPSTINGLKSLRILNLAGCSKLENVPENLGQVETLKELDVSGTAIRQPVPSVFLMTNLKALSFRGCKGPSSSTSWFMRLPISLMQRCPDPTALMLPSLSGLCSLTELNLSDCNLGEGAIPSDICNLFSLKKLNLSKNSFVSLPGTISHLPKLKHFKLDYCKRLQSLPELPSDIKKVRVDGCSSLETISDALKSCNSESSRIFCLNCLKLLDYNGLAFSMLQGFLEAVSNPRTKCSIVVPGSNIPEWFSDKNEGSSIRITRPPDSYNRNRLVGYAICSVFYIHEHLPTIRSRFYRTHKLTLHTKADKIHSSSAPFTHFETQFGLPVSDHLWLLYLSRKKYFDEEWRFEYNQIQFSFVSNGSPAGILEVKRCGVHPVYMQEVDATPQLGEIVAEKLP